MDSLKKLRGCEYMYVKLCDKPTKIFQLNVGAILNANI